MRESNFFPTLEGRKFLLSYFIGKKVISILLLSEEKVKGPNLLSKIRHLVAEMGGKMSTKFVFINSVAKGKKKQVRQKVAANRKNIFHQTALINSSFNAWLISEKTAYFHLPTF